MAGRGCQTPFLCLKRLLGVTAGIEIICINFWEVAKRVFRFLPDFLQDQAGLPPFVARMLKGEV